MVDEVLLVSVVTTGGTGSTLVVVSGAGVITGESVVVVLVSVEVVSCPEPQLAKTKEAIEAAKKNFFIVISYDDKLNKELQMLSI